MKLTQGIGWIGVATSVAENWIDVTKAEGPSTVTTLRNASVDATNDANDANDAKRWIIQYALWIRNERSRLHVATCLRQLITIRKNPE